MKKFSACVFAAFIFAISATTAFAAPHGRCDCEFYTCIGGDCRQGGVCGEPVVVLTYPEPYDGRERKPRGITIRIVPPRPMGPPPRIAPPPRPMGPPPRPLPPPRPRW